MGIVSKSRKSKKNIMREIKTQIEQKEQELIESNYKQKIQLERDVLVNNLQNLENE